jgi:uncharacterized protein DUF2804
MLDGLPYRGDGSDRPAGLALPPRPMPRRQGRRPLKRWRYVGVYGPDVMLCAGIARIAGARQSFWAVWDRSRLWERTRLRAGRVDLPDGAARVTEREVSVDLALEPDGDPVEVISRHGESYIWTRKTPLRATGLVTLEGSTLAIDAPGLLDDSAGYHARRTDWRWCAGVGEAPDGTPLAFNVVAGVHDAAVGSERTLWVGGAARELPTATFAHDLSSVSFAGGGVLAFAEEARRARADDFKIIASDYIQPFGTFSGTLPGGVALAEGYGVMERHRARW